MHGVPLLGSVLESLWLNQYKTSVSNVSVDVEREREGIGWGNEAGEEG